MFPVLGGAIGWITNYLAIKFLFWPRTRLRLGPLNIQGVIPRRRQELARAVGEVVATELLSRDQIAAALNSPDIRGGMAEMAREAVAGRIITYPLLLTLPRSIREKLADSVGKIVRNEVDSILAGGGPELTGRVLASVDLAGLVEEKLEAMDWEYLETIVYSVAGKELKVIEVMGGVLGALIGLIQAGVVFLLG